MLHTYDPGIYDHHSSQSVDLSGNEISHDFISLNDDEIVVLMMTNLNQEKN